MAWFRETMVGAAAVACAAVLAAMPAEAIAAGPPQVGATWVTEVTATSARLHAEIDPNGLSTTYYFEYVTDAAFQAEGFSNARKVPSAAGKALPSPSSPSKVDLLLTGPLNPLVAASAYHYRVVATNAADTSEGPERIFTTQGSGGSFQLLDGRAWEMVSPIDKGGGAVALPGAIFGGGDIQAAESGPGAITYGSGTAFGGVTGAPPGSQYVSRRTPAGWLTENVSPPLASAAYGDEPDGAPYRVFSASLARALFFGGLACRGGLEACPAPNPSLPGSGAPAGYMAYYLRDNSNGAFDSLLGAADVAHSAVSPPALELAAVAASPDLAHVILSTCAALTADASEVPAGPGRCDPLAQNLYEWSAGGLDLVNVRPGDATGTPGAAIAAPIGAVSADGSAVYWTQGGQLFLREGGQSAQVDEALGGGGTFQTASGDGSIGFFTKAAHLYRYDAVAESATDLTPSGGVQGVLGADASGDTVYYQDAVGLKRWRSGSTVTIAADPEAAAASDYPPATGTARVSPDGLHLAFLSRAELGSFDTHDADDGQPVSEVYLYGPAPLDDPPLCVSCNPTGVRPRGGATIPGALVNGSSLLYKPRVLSATGRLFFESQDALSLHDTNGTGPAAKDPHSLRDVYEWEAGGVGSCQRAPGCLELISSGRGSDDSTRFLDASADGSDVFFLTSEELVAADPGSIDVYDARVGGGIPEPLKPIPCVNDACQSLPAPPEDPTPGTLVPNAGNGRLRIVKAKPRKHARKRHGKHRRRHAGGARGRGIRR